MARYATLVTSMGDIKAKLLDDTAPKTVENFVGLATGTKQWSTRFGEKKNEPLYSGTIFHRVIPDFMIQGGDPLGNGTGGPGYKLADEFPAGKFEVAGRLAYVNTGANTKGSQFFMTEVPAPHFDARHHYTIIGTCDDATVE